MIIKDEKNSPTFNEQEVQVIDSLVRKLFLPDSFEPVALDLNHLFGAIGLKFSIIAESEAILCIGKVSNRGRVYVAAGENAELGDQARMIVKADDGTGCSSALLISFEICSSDSAKKITA